jgi:hypothetical protein
VFYQPVMELPVTDSCLIKETNEDPRTRLVIVLSDRGRTWNMFRCCELNKTDISVRTSFVFVTFYSILTLISWLRDGRPGD